MTLELREIFDPRDPWARTRRMQLVQYAEQLGIKEISEQMPHTVIVRKLKALGVKPPNGPQVPLGAPPRSEAVTPSSPDTIVLDVDELAELQWQAQQTPKARPIAEMTFNEMRAELKSGGVKLNRRWRMDEVKAELEKLRNGKQDAA